MLKHLSRSPDDFTAAWPQADQTNGQSPEHERARFRAFLWLGIAADIRRRRASEEMKGLVSC
jgi:hypothetical protein